MKPAVLCCALLILALLITAVPASGTVTCAASARCLTGLEAAQTFGAGNAVQQSGDICGYKTDAAGARTSEYCFAASGVTRLGVTLVTVTTTTQAPVRVIAATTPTTEVPVTTTVPAVTTTTTQAPVRVVTATIQTTAVPVTTLVPAVTTTTAGTSRRAVTTTTSLPVTLPHLASPANTTSLTPGVLVIGAGTHHYVPLVDPGSPYYTLINVSGLSRLPGTYLQTDYNDNNRRSYFDREFPAKGNWTDFSKLLIAKSDTDHVGNFRFMTGDTNTTGFFVQVSRYPFANDPDHWQNQYVAGLIASGQYHPYHTDDEGYQYFRVNFARVANQSPGDPPYSIGIVPGFDAGAAGTGMVKTMVDIPFTSTSIVIGSVNLGAFSLPVPVSVVSAPAGDLTQAQLGNPNENMILSCSDCPQLRAPTKLETAILNGDQTFYVRVIPVYEGGKTGVPTLPVKVTVRRPHDCPTVTSDVTIKLPSASIVWYMKPTFGDYGYQWYYPLGSGSIPKGWHSYEPPPPPKENSWWDDVKDAFKSVADYFSWIVTQYSHLWNFMEDTIVKAVGDTLTFGWCSGHGECTSVLKAGLQAVMAAYGIPPTLPTGPELMDLSTDYMVKLGADQLGAGELYDAYESLGPEAQAAFDGMKGDSQQIAESLADEAQAERDDMWKKNLCTDFSSFGIAETVCTAKIPDPIYASVHPATVLVYVNNPPQNSQATDRVLMTVSDSWGLYSPKTQVIPTLAPGESVSVPVVLEADYHQYLKEFGGYCDPNAPSYTYAGSSSYENLSTCLMGQWMGTFEQPGEDTFTVTYSNGQAYENVNSGWLSGLNAASNGKSLGFSLTFDKEVVGGACTVGHSLRFPAGWSVSTPSYSINPNKWDNFFYAEGLDANPHNGMLRNKP